MAFPRFPYTDFHQLNADWILEKVRQMAHTVEQYATDLANVVRVTAQTFTSGEKQQARENISAASDADLQTTQDSLATTNRNLYLVHQELETVSTTVNNLQLNVTENSTAIGGISATLYQHGLAINTAQSDITTLQSTSYKDVICILTSATEGYIPASEVSQSDFADLTKLYRLVNTISGVTQLVGVVTQARLTTVGGVSGSLVVQKAGLLLNWYSAGDAADDGYFTRAGIVLTWDADNQRVKVKMVTA